MFGKPQGIEPAARAYELGLARQSRHAFYATFTQRLRAVYPIRASRKEITRSQIHQMNLLFEVQI